jgi:predicted ATPase
MRFTRLRLGNWRNFRDVDLLLARRAFIVGPNASGKSNLLDAFRFLRDIAEPEGGFQRAVQDRGGVSQIHCLHARWPSGVAVEVEIFLDPDSWTYRLEFGQETRGKRRPMVRKERVTRNGVVLLDRPDGQDEVDENRLTQTHLEQVTANREFRPVAEALAEVRYLHVIPQLVRHPRPSNGGRDPFGSDFLEQLATTPRKTQEARLRKINQALKAAVPQLQELKLDRDELGVPHLKGLYEHWRPNAGWQTEEHFSDGTLRLLGLLWAFLDGEAPLLLEEPELSLHAAIVRHIPSMMARAGGKRARQVLISTHSYELLTDEGIAPEELVLLRPTRVGTEVELAAADSEIRALLESGETAAAVAMARTAPEAAAQLALFH